MMGRDDCFEVMNICSDAEIIEMFHGDEVVVTPNKVEFMLEEQ